MNKILSKAHCTPLKMLFVYLPTHLPRARTDGWLIAKRFRERRRAAGNRFFSS